MSSCQPAFVIAGRQSHVFGQACVNGLVDIRRWMLGGNGMVGRARALHARPLVRYNCSHEALEVFLWHVAVSRPLKEDSWGMGYHFEQAVQGHSELAMGQRFWAGMSRVWVQLWRLGLQELCYQSSQMERGQPKVLPKGLHIGQQLDMTGLYVGCMPSIMHAGIIIRVDERGAQHKSHC